ncbi:MAG: efflux RND transporter periplasmic adaptor subunit [Microbacter sp.]
MLQSFIRSKLFYVGLVFLSVSFAACRSHSKEKNTPIPRLHCMVVHSGDATVYTNYATQLQSENVVTIYSRATGYVDRLYVSEGDHVRKGQPILKIQDNDYLQAVRSAQAAYQNALLEVKKVTPLVEKGIISPYQLQTDQSNLEAAKANFENAKINLSYTLITSPVNGVIGQITLRQGSLITAGAATPITTVSSNGNMFAYFSIDEQKMLQWTDTLKGTLQDKIKRLPSASLLLADGTKYAYTGKISLGSGLVDPTTGSLLLKATFPNPQELLRTGSSGTLQLPVHYEHVLMVPQKATFDIQNKKMLYLVDSHGIVHATNIAVKAIAGNNYVVSDGVKEGDVVVTDGITQIKDGMKISPILN